jgi:hypothetical protein
VVDVSQPLVEFKCDVCGATKNKKGVPFANQHDVNVHKVGAHNPNGHKGRPKGSKNVRHDLQPAATPGPTSSSSPVPAVPVVSTPSLAAEPATKKEESAHPVVVIADSPPVPAAPARGQITGYITKRVNDKRLKIHKFKALASKTLYRWNGRAFFLDTSRAFLVAQKSAFLMFDIDASEPLDLHDGKGPQAVHTPIVIDVNCHSSQKLESLIKSKIFTQIAMGMRKASEFGLTTWILMGVGCLLGYFLGQVVPFGKL